MERQSSKEEESIAETCSCAKLLSIDRNNQVGC